jgi:hypothetical protein
MVHKTLLNRSQLVCAFLLEKKPGHFLICFCVMYTEVFSFEKSRSRRSIMHYRCASRLGYYYYYYYHHHHHYYYTIINISIRPRSSKLQ